jgi:hypothetical protein
LKLLALECSLLSFTHEQETSYSSYSLGWFCALKMEVIHFSETSVRIRTTRHYIPDDSNIHKCLTIVLEWIYSLRQNVLILYKCICFNRFIHWEGRLKVTK